MKKLLLLTVLFMPLRAFSGGIMMGTLDQVGSSDWLKTGSPLLVKDTKFSINSTTPRASGFAAPHMVMDEGGDKWIRIPHLAFYSTSEGKLITGIYAAESSDGKTLVQSELSWDPQSNQAKVIHSIKGGNAAPGQIWVSGTVSSLKETTALISSAPTDSSAPAADTSAAVSDTSTAAPDASTPASDASVSPE